MPLENTTFTTLWRLNASKGMHACACECSTHSPSPIMPHWANQINPLTILQSSSVYILALSWHGREIASCMRGTRFLCVWYFYWLRFGKCRSCSDRAVAFSMIEIAIYRIFFGAACNNRFITIAYWLNKYVLLAWCAIDTHSHRHRLKEERHRGTKKKQNRKCDVQKIVWRHQIKRKQRQTKVMGVRWTVVTIDSWNAHKNSTSGKTIRHFVYGYGCVCVQYGEGCGVAQIGWYNILVYARRFVLSESHFPHTRISKPFQTDCQVKPISILFCLDDEQCKPQIERM